MEFSRQEYWSGLPFSSPEDLPDPGIELTSLAWQVDSLLLSHQGSLSLGLLIFNFGELGELKNKNGPLGKLLKLSKSQFLIYKIEELIPALHGYRKHLDIYERERMCLCVYIYSGMLVNI